MGTARKRTRLLVLSVAATILGLSDRALAFDAHLDIDRFGVVPDSRTTFFVRVPTVGADLPVWGIGGALLYTPSLLRYRQYPQIGDREQALVEHRVEVDPYFFWYPVRDADQSLVFSVMLPIVINSGAQSGSFAAGDLVELDADEGFTLGDLQLSLFYSYSPVDTLVGGIGLDLRLPTGVFRPASLATDNLVRIFPRIQLGWTPVEWLQLVLEAGDQITLPGYEEGPLTGPLTTEGQKLLSETVGNLAISFLLPKRWFISFETSYSFNTEKIASAQQDYDRQLQLLLSFGSTFDVGPGDLQFHLGGRYNPLPARREVGATHGGALLRMDYVPRDRCEAPSLEVARQAPGAEQEGDGCVSFEARATPGSDRDWTIVTKDTNLVLSGRNLEALDDGGAGTLVLVPEGRTVSDPDALDLRSVAKVETDGERRRVTIGAAALASVRAGRHTVVADTACETPAQQALLFCPRIAVTKVPAGMVVRADERFEGTFALEPGMRLAVSSEALGYTFDVSAEPGGFTLGRDLLLPVGQYDLTVRASGADWLAHCPGVRVDLVVDERKCCDELLTAGGVGALVKEQGAEAPHALIRRVGACTFETRIHFAVGQDDMPISDPTQEGSPAQACTVKKAQLPARVCEAMTRSGCTQCGDDARTLADMRTLLGWASTLGAQLTGDTLQMQVKPLAMRLDVKGFASEVVTESGAAVSPDGWTGKLGDLSAAATNRLAERRARRLESVLCAPGALDASALEKALTRALPGVSPGSRSSDAGAQVGLCGGVPLMQPTWEPVPPCSGCSVEHVPGEPMGVDWSKLRTYVENQKATARLVIELPHR
ncbi:MAG: hypothetical protein AMXMBFR64_52800 [Myxococcales bacterium]